MWAAGRAARNGWLTIPDAHLAELVAASGAVEAVTLDLQLQQVPVVAALSPEQALGDDVDWHRVDVVLVDIWDATSTAFDRYVGVAIAERIRALRPLRLRDAALTGRLGEQLTIIAVSRHMPNAAMNHRLHEAGVDLRFDREAPPCASPANSLSSSITPKPTSRHTLSLRGSRPRRRPPSAWARPPG